MKLGTKINLVLILVTSVVLTTAFGLIVSIEADTTKKQVVNEAETAADIFHSEIERMFTQVNDQQVRLQNTIDELSRIEGVVYINVTGMDGIHIAATKHELTGTRVDDADFKLIKDLKIGKKVADVKTDKGTYYEIEQRLPIKLVHGDIGSEVINVIEVEVATHSKSDASMAQSEGLLSAISASIEQTARSIIVTRQEDVKAIQAITDSVMLLGRTNKGDQFGYYHDFVIFDNKLNIIANTGHEVNEFLHDPLEYKKYREDVVSGKIKQAYYERLHEDESILVRVRPIYVNGKEGNKIVGIKEIHILISAYTDKIVTLELRMLAIGLSFMVVLVAVLAVILRRQVVLPITRYSSIARKIADGDLSQMVEHSSSDEIGQFGEVFNSMVKNLRELDKLKSDFISVAAHQLRTPLSGVKWTMKLLLDGDLGAINDDQKGMIKRGYDTNEKMIQLVNDLLNVSRIESGSFGYEFKKNDFMKLLETLVENTVLSSKEHNIKIALDNKVGIIPEFVFDTDKLLIALQNIVDNAMKYTLPGGSVTIAVERQGDFIEIKVSDTGVGIPKEEIAKLFTKFFRATNVIHLQTDGSGLGLFIVKNIIVRHGGQVWVDSVEGKGTTFTVVIPIVAELLPEELKKGEVVS